MRLKKPNKIPHLLPLGGDSNGQSSGSQVRKRTANKIVIGIFATVGSGAEECSAPDGGVGNTARKLTDCCGGDHCLFLEW